MLLFQLLRTVLKCSELHVVTGEGGKPATKKSMQSTLRAAHFYALAAAIEREEEADDGVATNQKPSKGGGDAHNSPAVPSAALSESAKHLAAARAVRVSWQGQYAEAFMIEAGLPDKPGDLGAAVHAYVQIAVRTHFAPRPLVAVIVALHRCAARAFAEPIMAALQPLATVARGTRRALFGV